MGFLEGVLEGAVFVVGAVDQFAVIYVQIFEDSVDSGEKDLFFSIFAQELRFSSLEGKVNQNGITFSDSFVSVEHVGEGDCRVKLDQFGLILIKPLGCCFRSLVSDLGIVDAQILK